MNQDNIWATRLLAYWIVLNLSLVTIWDLVVLTTGMQIPTVSFYLYDWGRRFPLVYFWAGICVGHLVLPLVVLNHNNAGVR